MLRIVQCGVGSFGRSWADVVKRSRVAELVAVVDPAAEARARVGEVLGVTTYPDLDTALAEVACDAVLVTTPPATHHAVATRGLRAGKPVLLEKPLAATMDEARDLVQTAEATGLVLMVSQNYRFRPPARAAQAVVQSGALGKLTHVKVRFARETRTLFGAGNFRYSMRYPLVLDMSIHHFDLLRCLTGQNVVQVYAREWPVPDSPYVYPPTVAALMTLDGGGTVVYEGNWASHGTETSWNAAWEVVGAAGRLLWNPGDMHSEEVWTQRWGEALQPVALPGLDLTERDATLAAFARAVETGQPPETRAADNIHSLAIVFACIESIERGETVRLG
ncbi:MAG: Gfo/Idh/MocA family oxidoreductase [Anaerolineae bacterium]|nr:Gfo/Idh/MocA family oxidoreductase [Anaerolineae bacterium]